MYILDALWRGKILPNERTIKPDSDYRRLADKLTEECEKFRVELSQEGKMHFNEYEMLQNEMNCISEEEIFIEAFRMGARMILDIIGDYQPRYQQKTAGE